MGPTDEVTVLAGGLRIVGVRDGRAMLTPLPDARSTMVLTAAVIFRMLLTSITSVVGVVVRPQGRADSGALQA